MGFRQIPALIEDVLSALTTRPVASLEDVLAADLAACERAERWLMEAGVMTAPRPLRQAAGS